MTTNFLTFCFYLLSVRMLRTQFTQCLWSKPGLRAREASPVGCATSLGSQVQTLLFQAACCHLPSPPPVNWDNKRGMGGWQGASRSAARCLVSLAGLGCFPGVPAVPGGLLELKSMIEKVTGKSAIKNYGFYGCYCGWGGRGTPKDGTDW